MKPAQAATAAEDGALEAIYAQLASQFLDAFPADLPVQRTVGRELEFPVVDGNGRAADVRRLWHLLLAEGDLTPKYDAGNANLIVEAKGANFSYTIEVGVGTLEINTRPCQTLFEVQAIAEEAVARLVHAAARLGWRVLGYGIQPVTAPSLAIMTPKQRYQSLYRAMGAEWLWYTVTAADQTHVAIARDEAMSMLNYGNIITPVLVSLCANSPIYEGTLSPFCSGREGQHALIHANEHRHGIPDRAYVDAGDFVRRVSQSIELVRRSDGDVIPNAQPFWRYLLENGADYDAFLFHEHYLWNSARIRASYGTIEVRPCCQQPWGKRGAGEHMAASALIVGLIEAQGAVQDYLELALGTEYWQVMRDWQQRAIRQGLSSTMPALAMLEEVVALAERGLRQRGFGEERLLETIWRRLELRENPAQRARRIFRNDGLEGLLDHAAIRPSQVN